MLYWPPSEFQAAPVVYQIAESVPNAAATYVSFCHTAACGGLASRWPSDSQSRQTPWALTLTHRAWSAPRAMTIRTPSPISTACGLEVSVPPSDSKRRDRRPIAPPATSAVPRVGTCGAVTVRGISQLPSAKRQCRRSPFSPTANASTSESPVRTAHGSDITTPPNDCHGVHAADSSSTTRPDNCATCSAESAPTPNANRLSSCGPHATSAGAPLITPPIERNMTELCDDGTERRHHRPFPAVATSTTNNPANRTLIGMTARSAADEYVVRVVSAAAGRLRVSGRSAE